MSRNASKNGRRRLLPLGTVVMLAALIAVFIGVESAPAQAPPLLYDDQCLGQTVNPANCTANDFSIERLETVDVLNSCAEDPVGFFTATVEAWMPANQPGRYNVGFFIALDGTESAITGINTCLHGYLESPLRQPAGTEPTYIDLDGDGIAREIYRGLPGATYPPPTFPVGYEPYWYNADDNECGDMEDNASTAIKTFNMSAACADQDGNGQVDVWTCGSWDNNVQNACNDVTGARPGTPSKCSCNLVNLPFTPTAVDLAEFSAGAQGAGILLTWETAAELDSLGFKVYRAGSMNGARAQLNQRLILSQAPGSAMGGSYTFLDETAVPGMRYYYWLEDVDVHGAATRYGPASAKALSDKSLPGRGRPAPRRSPTRR